MHAIPRAVAGLALLLACVRPAHAEDGVPRDAWFSAMQAADPAAAVALYDAAEESGQFGGQASRAAVDRALIRGRALEMGREIPVDERTVRLQVHTSADAWLLLTWRRGKDGWHVAKTEKLAPELFDEAGPTQWPVPAAQGPTAEPVEAFLLRWVKATRSTRWTEASMAAEFFLAGRKPQAIRAFLSAGTALPVVFVDRMETEEDATAAEVRIRVGLETFRVDAARSKEGWRIAEIVAVPRSPVNGPHMTRADAEQIARFAAALERALQPDGSPRFLLDAGVDGDGATPTPFTEASAKAQLERWRAQYGPIRIQKFNTRDFAQDFEAAQATALVLGFSSVDDAKGGGYVRFLPLPDGWRLLGLRSGVREEFVHVEDVVVPR